MKRYIVLALLLSLFSLEIAAGRRKGGRGAQRRAQETAASSANASVEPHGISEVSAPGTAPTNLDGSDDEGDTFSDAHDDTGFQGDDGDNKSVQVAQQTEDPYKRPDSQASAQTNLTASYVHVVPDQQQGQNTSQQVTSDEDEAGDYKPRTQIGNRRASEADWSDFAESKTSTPPLNNTDNDPFARGTSAATDATLQGSVTMSSDVDTVMPLEQAILLGDIALVSAALQAYKGLELPEASTGDTLEQFSAKANIISGARGKILKMIKEHRQSLIKGDATVTSAQNNDATPPVTPSSLTRFVKPVLATVGITALAACIYHLTKKVEKQDKEGEKKPQN